MTTTEQNVLHPSEVRPKANQPLKTFHLFCGAGGGVLADLLLGHLPVGACEIEPYPRNVLLARQRDGHLPEFPIWDDVCTLDGKPWRGSVDVLCGGFPCTDISAARTNSKTNGKQNGLKGKYSGLWSEYSRIISEMRPNFIFVENSPNLRTKGLVRILKDFNCMGYNARWGVLGSIHIGADHHRKRMWILAYANEPQRKRRSIPSGIPAQYSYAVGSSWRKIESNLERVADGLATGLDANWSKRIKAIGNGQDPRVAATAFSILSEGLI
ncbi:MAG: DNA cytosine methyltransferase [Gammaproteobacteria bacterium]|nr:DNA cytosine methyltransferase [Gammaproteobacteria bacterium]